MAIEATKSKVHWNYFLALEHDMELVARYIEFSLANMSTYSVELAHLLLAASSEVDVVAKLLCQRLENDSPRGNIDQYRVILTRHIPTISAMQVFVPRYGLTLTPWDNWASDNNPDWWRSHNNVKHERDYFFHEATLKNSLNALAALLTLTFHHYSYAGSDTAQPLSPKNTTRSLRPQSSLMQFSDDYYNAVRITA